MSTAYTFVHRNETQKWTERATISIRNDGRYLFSNSVRVNLAAFSYESVSTVARLVERRRYKSGAR